MSSESGQRINEKFHCIANEFEDKKSCNSSDALSIYEKQDDNGNVFYDAFCWSCGQSFSKHQVHNSSHAATLGVNGDEVLEKRVFKLTPKAEPLTREEIKEHVANTGYKSLNYRGIRDEIRQFFGHTTKLSEDGSRVIATYYPETETVDVGKYVVVGYKCRVHPKDFSRGKIGRTGKNSNLSGQVKW